MAEHFRTQILVLASSVAVALVVTAYVFSGPFSFRPSIADAATAETLLKAYATKDSDTDGLPDWQETLYGTDPANAESFKAGITDGEAVAQGLIKPQFESDQPSQEVTVPGVAAGSGTLTDAFARTFFESYVSRYGNTTQISEAELQAFTNEMVLTLAEQSESKNTYSLKNVTVSGSGPAALRTYIAAIEEAFATHTIPTEKDELSYMTDAIEKSDSSALSQVAKIGAAYTAIATACGKVSVPTEAKQAHVAVVRALFAVGEATTNMSTVNRDPIRALVGLAQYPKAAKELALAFAQFGTVFTSQGVTLTEGEAGYSIYRTASQARSVVTP